MLPPAISPGSACLPPWQALSSYQYFEIFAFCSEHTNFAPPQ
jgi:hypothetical protein